MKRLYVIVRKDLPWIHQAVQAGHAVAEYLILNPNTQWNNGYLIYVGVPDEQALFNIRSILEEGCNKKVTVFREPDRCDTITAMAVECNEENEVLSKLPLL